jgi:hypothetical protein
MYTYLNSILCAVMCPRLISELICSKEEDVITGQIDGSGGSDSKKYENCYRTKNK